LGGIEITHNFKCDGKKPTCGRCLRHGIECKFIGRDDGRGTAPKSLVMLLQSRIELLEKVLWFHSIDLDASVAKLQASEGFSGRPAGNGSLPEQQLQESAEPDGTLCSKESLGLEEDGEASFFGSSSGRVELLKSNGCMLFSRSSPFFCYFQILADDGSGYRYGTSSVTTVSPLSLESVLSRDWIGTDHF
jgi:hypothetical protein